MTTEEVMVFIDAQNMYRGARDAFFSRADYHVNGQLSPAALAELLRSRGRAGIDRILSGTRVYTGRPDATKQPIGYSAHMKQCAAWAASGVTVIARTLRYSRNWPVERESEKGIDVRLAIDIVTLTGEYDVAVVASGDTDLAPAIEHIASSPSEKHGWRVFGGMMGPVQ